MKKLQKTRNKLFTLIELIVVIVVIGILAAIVIPNVSSFKEDAEKTAIVSDTRNIQTAVDLFMLENHGLTPTIEKPTFDKPQTVQLYGLKPDYLRTIPKSIEKVHFWLDSNNMVHSSYVDAPTGVEYVNGILSWNSVSGASAYNIYTLQATEVTAKVKSNHLKIVKENHVPKNTSGILTFDELDGEVGVKTYVSAVDKFGFESVVTGMANKYTGYEKPDKNFIPKNSGHVDKGIPVKVPLESNLSYHKDQYTYIIPSVVEVKSTAPRYGNSDFYYLGYLFDGVYSGGYSDRLNEKTYWLTNSTGNQFLTFNFYKPIKMSHVSVAPRTRHDHHSDYRIFASNDNSNWEELVSWQEGNIPLGTLNTHEIEGEYQYYRFELTRVGSWGVSLAEVEFFEYEPINPPKEAEKSTAMPTLTSNTSHSDYVTLSSTNATTWGGVHYDMYKAFDGITDSTSNGWMASATSNAFLEVYFKDKRALSDIGLYLGPNINVSLEGRAKDFAIQYFDLTSNEWKTALDSTLQLQTGEQRFTVPAVGEHNRWRLFIKNHHYSGSAYIGIEEWKIY